MSALAHLSDSSRTSREVREVPILLQKSLLRVARAIPGVEPRPSLLAVVETGSFDAPLALTPSTQRDLTLTLHRQRTAEVVGRRAWRGDRGSGRWRQV